MKAKVTGQSQRTGAERKNQSIDQFNEGFGATFPFKQSSAYRGGPRGAAGSRKLNANQLVKAAAIRARLDERSLNELFKQVCSFL
jgi:hypothetical protein